MGAAAVSSSSDPGRPFLAVDIGAYLSSADLLWSWNASRGAPLDPLAPVSWSQGAYIGNGLLGAMVTAVIDASTNATTALRVDISRTDVWDCSNREPTGFLTVQPATAAALARVDMRLVLHTAQLSVNFTLVAGDAVSFSMLVNAGDAAGPTGLFALAVSAPTGGANPLTVSFVPDSSGQCSDAKPSSGQAPTEWGQPTLYSTQTFSSGTVTAAYTDFNDDGVGGSQTVLLAVANSQRAANATASLGDALAAVAAGHKLTAAGLRAAHTAWWDWFWTQTSFFSLGGGGAPMLPGVAALEQFAHIAGYRYASAARFTLHDLMGPWGPAHATTCIGPWCQYCWDMNQQVMMYLPGPSNRGALLAAPAFDMLPAVLDGSWAARYGSNAPGGASNVLWFTAQAWRHCLLHGDDARLRGAVLPLLRASLQKAGLHNGTSDGFLHVLGCRSPEYPMDPATDCNYDLAIIRWAARTALTLAAALDPTDPALPLYADIASRLAPYPVDPLTGSFAVAAGVPFAVPHRHYSHLLMLYDLEDEEALPPPGGNGSGGVAAAAAVSLDVWWNITCSGPQAHGPDWRGDDECRGFTQAAAAAMSTQLDRGAAALGNLTAYLRLVGLPNAMYGEEVFAGNPDQFSPVSESAYSAAASVYGALVRATPWPPGARWSGVAGADAPLVRLWPAVAALLANASAFRLRVPGALLVSAVRAGGATAWAAVEADLLADGSGAGGPVAPFALSAPDWAADGVAALAVVGAPGVAAALVQPGVFAVSGLLRGAAAAFYPAGGPAPGAFGVGAAAGANASEANWWGSRFVYRGELP